LRMISPPRICCACHFLDNCQWNRLTYNLSRGNGQSVVAKSVWPLVPTDATKNHPRDRSRTVLESRTRGTNRPPGPRSGLRAKSGTKIDKVSGQQAGGPEAAGIGRNGGPLGRGCERNPRVAYTSQYLSLTPRAVKCRCGRADR